MWQHSCKLIDAGRICKLAYYCTLVIALQIFKLHLVLAHQWSIDSWQFGGNWEIALAKDVFTYSWLRGRFLILADLCTLLTLTNFKAITILVCMAKVSMVS